MVGLSAKTKFTSAPSASVASELGGEPKTENWYVAATEPDASLIVGLKDGVSKEHFEKPYTKSG